MEDAFKTVPIFARNQDYRFLQANEVSGNFMQITSIETSNGNKFLYNLIFAGLKSERSLG